MRRTFTRAEADLVGLAGARPLKSGERMIGAAALRRDLALLSSRDDAAKDFTNPLARDRLFAERSRAPLVPHQLQRRLGSAEAPLETKGQLKTPARRGERTSERARGLRPRCGVRVKAIPVGVAARLPRASTAERSEPAAIGFRHGVALIEKLQPLW